MDPETTECPICLMTAENQVVTTCNHVFHKNCLSHWLSQSADKSCPICRTTQPNVEGELMTFWDNIHWVMKTYKFGNIERKFYPSGYLQYEFILSYDKRIIRSKLLSRDGTGIYCHTNFSREEIAHIRNGGELELPSIFQDINYIYNDDILNGLENIFNSIPIREEIEILDVPNI
jgi:hypothetical protein